jgi:hypothetical protein
MDKTRQSDCPDAMLSDFDDTLRHFAIGLHRLDAEPVKTKLTLEN